MTQEPLTEKEQKVLDFIRDQINAGRPPTCREIGRYMELASTNAVYWYVKVLERKNHITRDPLLSRSIRIVEAKPASSSWPQGQEALDIAQAAVTFIFCEGHNLQPTSSTKVLKSLVENWRSRHKSLEEFEIKNQARGRRQ